MSGTGHLAANGRFYKKDGKRNDRTKQKVFLNKKKFVYIVLCSLYNKSNF